MITTILLTRLTVMAVRMIMDMMNMVTENRDAITVMASLAIIITPLPLLERSSPSGWPLTRCIW
ncbi:hypothetical protein AA0472_0927 [Acetobacter estunensis NRIC 0472]|nr:hypothetical protein AA0472_0927 [Acetobacter estunensis NRIC 0472]